MRNRKWLCFVVIVTSTMGAGNVMAKGFGCPASSSPAEMIACLQARDAILSSELTVAVKEKALRKMGDVDSRHLSLPQVESTYGRPGRLKAVLHWRGGSSLVASRGDAIPGGYRVVAVLPGRVIVSGRNGQNHVLLMEGGSGGDGSVESPIGGTGTERSVSPTTIGARLVKSSSLPHGDLSHDEH
jgi:hypothetical protein